MDSLENRTKPNPRLEASGIADVGTIRSHFPALTRSCGGRPAGYFDGPGGTQVPLAVIRAMTQYLYHHNANAHWAFPTSRETDDAILDARQVLADWVGGSVDEIVFGANMTTLTFHLSRALARSWRRGESTAIGVRVHFPA